MRKVSECLGRLCLPFLAAALPAAAAPPPDSPFGSPSAERFGQVRTRTEYDGKALADTSANRILLGTHLRTRLGFTASPAENIGFRIELQDTRLFGQEPSGPTPATATVGNLKGIDLLQGYVTVQWGGFEAALGRQKMSLGSGRFLSTLEWHPYSRAFDGVSFNWEMGPGNLTGLSYVVRDTSAAAAGDVDVLTGLYYSHRISGNLTGDLYGFYDHSSLPSTVPGLAATNSNLYYIGERVAGRFGAFTFEEEFIWQGGEATAAGDLASAAFQAGLRIGGVFGRHAINAGADVLSGDDDASDETLASYRPDYGFAHAYFGWMDYFVANPRFGVIDYRLDADIGLLPDARGASRLLVKPAYHFFLPANAPSGGGDPYGQEIDLEAHVKVLPKSVLVFGAGLFLPGDNAYLLPAARLAAGQSSRPGIFLYFMPVFNF